MKVEWVKVDMSAKRSDLPQPLCSQSGGRFWVCMDGGIHGQFIELASWSGEKFNGCNNHLITHFAYAEFPEKPPR